MINLKIVNLNNFNKLKLVSSSLCGSVMPCSVYFTNNPFNTSLTILYVWTFQITSGYNQLVLPQQVKVAKGNFLVLVQLTGSVAIDTSGGAVYSDLQWLSMYWSKLNLVSNWRFYLNPIQVISYYLSSFSLTYKYNSYGSYQCLISDTNNKNLFRDNFNLSSCMFKKELKFILKLYCFFILVSLIDFYGSNSGNTFDMTANITYVLYTSIGTDSLFINFGNNKNKTISLNSGIKILH